MLKNRPLVTVLMSVYNENISYLKQALNSIIHQTYQNLEILIVNDFCNDACSSMLEHYAKKDSRIIIIKNDQNVGLTKSLNIGLKYTNGTYIARMDSDDVSSLNRIEHQVQFMEKNKDVAVCGTLMCNAENGEPVKVLHYSAGNETRAVRMMLYNAGAAHPTAMIRTDFLKKNGIRYNEEYKRAQDYALWSEIIYHGGGISTMPKVLLKYRMHAGQISNTFHEEQIQCARTIRIRNLERNLGVPLSKYEKELYQALAENVMAGTVAENIRLARKIESNATGVNLKILKKELLMNWWARGIKSIKNKEKPKTEYFLNSYALSIARPDNFIYAVRYFIWKA